jgi:hypothetical protein
LAPDKPVEDVLGAGEYGLVVIRGRRRRLDLGGVHGRQIARELQVDRPGQLATVPQDPRDDGGGGRRIVQPRLVARDLTVDADLAVDRLGLMVEEKAAFGLGSARSASQHHERRLLGISTGGDVDHVETARPVGDGRDAEPLAVVAAGRVGGEAHAGLVAQRVERQDFRVLNHLEERQDEVARDTEDLTRSMIFERVEENFT